MKLKNIYLSILTAFLTTTSVVAQTSLVTADYNKALWMSTRFFGGQRLTDKNHAEQQENWLVQDYLPTGVASSKRGIMFAQDADGSYDLSGGWADCGDHVFFGQTGFYAGYMLAKAYDEFPEGFDDYYGVAYSGYRTAGDYSWEGGKGKPNGIPDVLDELKHQTDFFIKCAKNSTTFYFEKGQGDADHAERVTAVKMQTNPVSTGGEIRKMWSNPNDASMPAMCSATLALMSRVYRPFDPVYADKCLVHAKYAYDYSKSKTGTVGAASGGFYSGNDNYLNGRAIMYSEMYQATGTASYKTEAMALTVGISTGQVKPNEGYTFDYSNTGEMALYCLAQIGHTSAKSTFNTRIQNSFINATNYNTAGVYKNGGGWGKLRYVGNAAFLVSLYNKLNNSATLDAKVYSNIDYIMGKNSGSWSFIVGFSPLDNTPVIKTPNQAHHRNLYLYEGNNNNYVATIPTKNKQFGSLVGGSLDGTYNDVWTEYVNTEVCVDYNVGLVGALAAIKKEKDPIDTNKFLVQCSAPNLGTAKSLCGVSNITLVSGLTNNNQRTFQWFKDGVSQGAASKSATSLTISSAGEWSVTVDSLGKCSRTSKVTISATLPTIDLGEDFLLCSPSSKELTTGVSGNGISHVWTRNNATINNQTSNTYTVTNAGTYKVTASASGCTSKSDEIIITSALPTTVGDVFCPNSQYQTKAQLLVTSTGGPYDWYATNVSTTKLFTGNMYEVSPTNTTTYYVKDGGSFTGSVGPATASGTLNAWGEQGYADGFYMKFDALKTFNITALSLPFSSIYNTGDALVGVEVRDASGALKGTFTSDPTPLTQSSTFGLKEFKFSDLKIQASWGSNLSLSLEKNITNVQGQLGWHQNGTYSFPYTASGAVSITGANTQGQSGNNYVYFFNWKISSGSECDRVPVTATKDCTVGTNDLETVSFATLYPNPSSGSSTLELNNFENTSVQVYTLTGVLVDEFETQGNVSLGQNFKPGTYIIRIQQGSQIQTLKFNKN